MMRHFTEIDDLSPAELERVLDLSSAPASPTLLAGKGVALIFEKPSARTRNSMEMAVVQLGGHPVYIGNEEVGLDRRESTEDVIRAMSGFHAAVGARVYRHSIVERMAAVDQVPVVTVLSDRGHPMQALADLLTIHQEFGALKGRSVAYVGDANNVAFSLALGAGLAQMEFRIASPVGYGFDEADLARISVVGEPRVYDSPVAAVEGADAVYTDAWTSMGQEAEASKRTRDFEGFQIDEKMMASAADESIFLHCLPAHRGEEVTDAVLDGPSSRIWPQAANRMHAARGLLVWLLGEANR